MFLCQIGGSWAANSPAIPCSGRSNPRFLCSRLARSSVSAPIFTIPASAGQQVQRDPRSGLSWNQECLPAFEPRECPCACLINICSLLPPALQQASHQPTICSESCAASQPIPPILRLPPHFSPPKFARMPKWEDIRDDLFEAIVQANPPISKEQQVEIVATMKARGHDMGWNAIRYVPRSSTIWLFAGPELEKEVVLLAAISASAWLVGRRQTLLFLPPSR